MFERSDLPDDQINVGSFIKFPLFLLRLLFFDFKPLKENPSVRERVFYSIKNFYSTLCLVGLCFATVSIALYGLENLDEFAKAASALTNVLTVIIIGFKGFVTLIGKKNIWNIIQELSAMSDQRLVEKKSFKIRKYLNEYQFYMKIYAGCFLSVFLRIISSFIPLLLYGIMDTAVKFWYPFDETRTENYIFVLIWSDWIGTSCSIFLLACDGLLYALIAVVAMEFDILRLELMNIEQTIEGERALKLKELVGRQNQLLKISEKIEEMYGVSFLCSVVVDSFSICFLLFTLSKSTDFSASAFDVPHLFVMAGQTFLLCFFGQKLIDSSQSVADGVYHSYWENLTDLVMRKNFILVILRSQKAKKLTAMSFVDISLATFTSVSLSFISNL